MTKRIAALVMSIILLCNSNVYAMSTDTETGFSTDETTGTVLEESSEADDTNEAIQDNIVNTEKSDDSEESAFPELDDTSFDDKTTTDKIQEETDSTEDSGVLDEREDPSVNVKDLPEYASDKSLYENFVIDDYPWLVGGYRVIWVDGVPFYVAVSESFDDILSRVLKTMKDNPESTWALLKCDDNLSVDTISSAIEIFEIDDVLLLRYDNAQVAKKDTKSLNKLDSVEFAELDNELQTETNSEVKVSDAIESNSRINRNAPIVAILDTGISLSDNQLVNRIMDSGVDLCGDSEDSVLDKNGHGTLMARIINEKSAGNVRILPVKIANDKGEATIISTFLGIEYAMKHDADIINLSLLTTDSIESRCLEYAISSAKNVVVSAGNQSDNTANYSPANLESAIVVSAVSEDGSFAEYSNSGDTVDLSACGDYEGNQGTSCAAAVVSGLLCNNSYEELMQSGLDLGDEGWDAQYGYATVGLQQLNDSESPVYSYKNNGFVLGSNTLRIQTMYTSRFWLSDSDSNEGRGTLWKTGTWEESNKFNLPAEFKPTRAGYVFKGWSDTLLLQNMGTMYWDEYLRGVHYYGDRNFGDFMAVWEPQTLSNQVYTRYEFLTGYVYLKVILPDDSTSKYKISDSIPKNWHAGSQQITYAIHLIDGADLHATLKDNSYYTQSDYNGYNLGYQEGSRQYVFPVSVKFNNSYTGYHIELVGVTGNDNLASVMTGYGKNWVSFNTDTNDNGMTNYTTDKKYRHATYTVQYVPNKYKLKLNPKGGAYNNVTDNTVVTTVYDSQSCNSIGVPTRTGYNFAGWYTSDGTPVWDSNGYAIQYQKSTTYWKNGYDWNANWMGGCYSDWKHMLWNYDDDLTVYAHWSPYKHTIAYNANGGSGAPSKQTKTYGTTLKLSKTKPTRDGYTFTSWNTKRDGSGTSYVAGDTYGVDLDGGTVTLYAQWKRNQYTVTYDCKTNGGDSNFTAKVYFGYNIDLGKTGRKTGDTGTYSTANPDGWQFVGWNTNKNATSGLTSMKMPAGNTTLYAIFKKTITARFKQYRYSGTDVCANVSDVLNTSKSSTVYNNVTTATLNDNTRGTITGWSCDGWTTGTTEKAGLTSNFEINQDTQYYMRYSRYVQASFISERSTIKLGGTRYRNSAKVNDSLPIVITTPVMKAKTGWSGIGWTLKKRANTVADIKQKTSYSIYDNVSFYGVYTKSVTVSYDANGGDVVPASSTKSAYYNTSGDVTYPSFILADAIHKNAVAFKNWNTKIDGSGDEFESGVQKAFSDSQLLYATFEDIDVTGVALNVQSLSLLIHESGQLNATMQPLSATRENVVYESEDSSIATVDVSGVVTGVSAGVTNIIVKSADNPDVSTKCQVVVSAGSVSVPDRLVLGSQGEIKLKNNSTDGARSKLYLSGLSNLIGVNTGKQYALVFDVLNDSGNETKEVNDVILSTDDEKSILFTVHPNVSLSSLLPDKYNATIHYKLVLERGKN